MFYLKASNLMAYQLSIMAKPNYLLQYLGVLIFLTVPCRATMYTVGDTSGWDISTDLDSWPSGKKFVPGDVLSFQYSSPFSVCEVTKKGYDMCNTNNVLQRLTSGNTTFPLTKPGDLYFSDCNRLYCLSGMKLEIHVTPNSTAGSLIVVPGPGPAPAPAGLLPNSNNPTFTSSAEFTKAGQPFSLFFLISYFMLGCII